MVSSGEDVRDLVTDAGHVHLAGKPPIGAMRNAGCERARGDLIAHFDDDDFSHPERLTDQVTRLLASGLAMTGYCSMRFTDGVKWRRYVGVSNYALGTSLLYRRAWWQSHRFLEVQVGEDNDAVRKAAVERQLVTADAGEFMWASTHPGNSSPRNMEQWKPI